MNELPLNQILCGNCVEVLKDFPDDSIDLVVTDPPYGLSFMGKDWDKTLPPREAFDEIIRVLKPGALAFLNCTPRQDLMARMILLLEDAGFETKQSFIDWIYKTGFPKAYDVSKGIDKKLGNEREVINIKIRGDVEEAKKTGVTFARATANRNNKAIFGYGIEKITRPASELSTKWSGWKSQTGLKPAHEPILMVNKPFTESTIVDNVLKWGTGAINVDSCRIPFSEETAPNYRAPGGDLLPIEKGWNKNSMERTEYNPPSKGRFPANLLVSDKAIDDGELQRGGITNYQASSIYGNKMEREKREVWIEEWGGKSRYFDLDAWAEHHGFLDVPKPNNSERDFGLKGKKRIPTSKLNLSDGKNPIRLDGAIPNPRRNIHPTVKPIQLMAYLIELGCPPDGVVLDPFVGSGTTCIAAKQLVRKYIGIEINPEYHALAKARLEAYPIPLSWFTGTETQDVLVPPIRRKEE